MRTLCLLPAAVVAFGLSAQVADNLVQRYNQGLPEVTKALDALKHKDACAKADALVPAQPPVFQGKDLPSIARSLENGRGMLALLKLQANTQAASGEWEKARDIQQRRVDYAKTLQGDLKAALEVQDAAWKKTVGEAKAYLDQNEAKIPDLEKRLAQLQTDIKAFNDKKVKLDAKQVEDLKARAAKAPAEDAQLQELKSRIPAYKDAMNRSAQFAKWSSENQQAAAAQVEEARASLEKITASIKAQGAEIEAFNQVQNAKKPRPKVAVTGSKTWVAAVMHDHANLTKLASVKDQAGTLRRLLVLDPENKEAAQALGNLEQGRDPFAGFKPAKKK